MTLWATCVSVFQGMTMKDLKGVKNLKNKKEKQKLPYLTLALQCLSYLVQL